MRNTYIYTETKKLIKKYGTRDPFEIMDQMNIVVGETSRYKTLKGYCFMSCKTIYVMISSFLSEEDKMIVAAHELGHGRYTAEGIAKGFAPAVVSIEVYKNSGGYVAAGQGSGIIMSADG